MPAPSAPLQNDYLPRKARIISSIDLTAKEKLFRLEFTAGKPLGHTPGQFIEIGIPGIGEAPISLCSSPTEGDFFELCIRDVGNVTHALHMAKAGDEVLVRGPYRKGFPLDILKKKDLILIGGGLGVVPLRSLVNYIKDKRSEFKRVIYLYGTKTTGSMLFIDEVEEAQRNYGFECLVTVDRAVKSWGGRIGLITTLISNIKIPLAECQAVIVGPPIMYKFVLKELFAYGMQKENIYLSLERNMKCGIGRCGRCQIGPLYTCKDGPVFNYTEIEKIEGAI
jgi:sulfhydrogenase subunit gamma (sulfur reductase)